MPEKMIGLDRRVPQCVLRVEAGDHIENLREFLAEILLVS